MKIIVSGSLGNISKPLTQELVQKGHSVIVISRSTDRKKNIEALGAKAAIGTVEDPNFLTETFSGADVVYAMEAFDEGSYFDKNFDLLEVVTKIADNYKQAIQESGIKRIIHLSSVGAHTNKGNGILEFHYNAENTLKQLPNDVFIKFMRPVGFYYNMFPFIQSIKTQGAIISNYGGDEKEPWVSPLDIAAVIAEEIELPFEGRTIRYIASDEVSPNEAAKILGEAIGKPDLKRLVISDEQALDGMIASGMNPNIAKGLVELNTSIRSKSVYEDYYRNRPRLGKVKLGDFAKEFAAVYNQP